MIVERLDTPATQPFEDGAMVDHLRMDSDQWDEANRHGRAAAAELEQYAGLALFYQPVRVTLEAWPRACWLRLPIAPLIDPMSPVVTVDGSSFDGFAVIAGLRPALRLTGERPCGLIVVEYQAGFGDAVEDIPEDLRLAILDQAAASFDWRGQDDGKSNGMSPQMARIAARYRRVAL